MLVKYAHQFTNSKKGAKRELDRINRYLIAAKLPQLRQEPTDSGGFKLVDVAGVAMKPPFPPRFRRT